MKIADNHCHILKQYYPNTIDFVKKLKSETNLEYVSTMGLNYGTNEELLDLKKQFIGEKFLKIGLGLHPSEIIDLGEKSSTEFEKIKNQILENKEFVDIIGEIGMDFSYQKSRNFESEQKKIFKEFIQLSIDLNLPVSIHCREAWDEVMEVLDEFDHVEGYLHSFTGSFEQGMFCIEKGLKLGLNGIITFKKSEDLRGVISELVEFYSDKDIDDIFGLETDSPYLSPEPNRSKENSPENIPTIAEYFGKITQLKD